MKFTKIILIGTIFIFSGCAIQNITKKVNPVSMEQQIIKDKANIFDRELIEKYKNFSIIVKKGETLSKVLKDFNDNNPYGYMIVNNVKTKTILNYPYKFKTLNNLAEYVKATTKTRLNIKRFNDKIFKISEITNDENIFKENYLVGTSKLNFEDRPVYWEGNMNEKDIISMIQEDFNIPIVLKSDINNNKVKSKLKLKRNSKLLKNILRKKFIKNYNGTIKKLIQRIAIENKLFIKFQQGIVILSAVDTRIFKLKMPYIDLATAEKFKGLTNVVIQPYKDLEDQLKSILDKNAVLNINKSSGDILIKGDYDDIRESQIIIKNFHDMYKKTIHLDVYVYEVNLNKNNKFGVSFESQYFNKTGSYNDKILSTTINPNLALFSYTKDFLTSGTTTQFNKFFLSFLNQFGNAKILTKPKLSTINGIPVYMEVTETQEYIKEISETLNTDTNTNTTSTATSTNVTPDKITTGFTLGIYPITEKNGKIKLLVKPVITQLLGLDEYKYGTEDNPKTIQLVHKSDKDFSQTINLQDGEIAIISGYMYEKNNAQKNTFPFMDSSKDSILDPVLSTKQKDISKVEMVIAIKATISY